MIAAAALPRTRVLYVDDDKGNRVVVSRGLASRYDVVTAASGEDAIAAMRGGGFDAIVTDQRMPAMLGTELLDRLREFATDLPSVVVSAYGDDLAVRRCLSDRRAARFVVKPFSMDELAVAIEECRAIAASDPESLDDVFQRAEADLEYVERILRV